MRLKNIMVSKFNVNRDSGLVENLPYVLENVETHEREIGTLVLANEEKLVFNIWNDTIARSITLTPSDIESYHIYKASSKDGISVQIEDEDGMNIVCHRIIDYKNQNFAECCTTGIEKFYKVDTESGVTVIKQFLYKVTHIKDDENDQVQYTIVLPVSARGKKYYMDNGWKIHPMFYNKKNDCYVDRVILGEKHVIDFTRRAEDSITIQILSGIQMLYLVEFGLKQNPNLSSGIYAGIQYEEGFIVISNAYVDEKNYLYIDNELQSIIVHDGIGYITRFKYWNENYDWLFLPEKTDDSGKSTLTESYYGGPMINLKNIILWGDAGSNIGIFRLHMFTTATGGDEYIVPWEFGE